ncbi:MAG: AraC family transcriptional regulator [Cellvibrio sp.]|jgi:inactivated superfamily I helicase|nr:AraC family transcriptional regulator [Cellvibrio sp.]
MRIALRSLAQLTLILISLYSSFSYAEDATPTADTEALKESVLTLNRDLLILEEELLYPASSQVAIYLSMDLGTFFALDAVKVEIDNQLITSELYSDKQTQALFRGGVQRLYVGNLKTGEHEISAIFTGRGPNKDYKRGAKLIVNKTTDPLVLELRIQDSESQMQPKFDIKQWEM